MPLSNRGEMAITCGDSATGLASRLLPALSAPLPGSLTSAIESCIAASSGSSVWLVILYDTCSAACHGRSGCQCTDCLTHHGCCDHSLFDATLSGLMWCCLCTLRMSSRNSWGLLQSLPSHI
jgi:hypothetical protein